MDFLIKHSVCQKMEKSNQYSYFTLYNIYLKFIVFGAFTMAIQRQIGLTIADMKNKFAAHQNKECENNDFSDG